jgi:hypothetical protein
VCSRFSGCSVVAGIRQRGRFIAVFPLTFASSARSCRWCPCRRGCKAFAVITRSRSRSTHARAVGRPPAGDYDLAAILWSLAIIAVFAPLAVARYPPDRLQVGRASSGGPLGRPAAEPYGSAPGPRSRRQAANTAVIAASQAAPST